MKSSPLEPWCLADHTLVTRMRGVQPSNGGKPPRWWWQAARNLCGKLIYLWTWLPNPESAPSTATPLNCLQPINPGYSGNQHPTVGKEVTVLAKNNPWQGHVGTAKSHNIVLNTFQVVFPMAIISFYAQELWLE